MKKIPTIFDRDWQGDRSRVTRDPNPEAAWVFAGEGAATKKIDGTSCAIIDGKFYKRLEVRAGKPVPADFLVSTHDTETNKVTGWIPVGQGPEDQYHREAFAADLADGTYELVGPKIQGNPEKLGRHELIDHASLGLADDVPTDFDALREWLSDKDIEGVVWHHPDGRMAKIKKRDFGQDR